MTTHTNTKQRRTFLASMTAVSAAAALPASAAGVDVVVRALPSAVTGDLRGDFDSALSDCLERLAS